MHYRPRHVATWYCSLNLQQLFSSKSSKRLGQIALFLWWELFLSPSLNEASIRSVSSLDATEHRAVFFIVRVLVKL